MRNPVLPLLVIVGLTGCLAPPMYWAESIHGRVVDADSGAPVEGAVVVADWKLYGGGMGHGGHRDSLFVEETVTDSNGEFRFGKWGPKLRPLSGELDTAPWLVVFKAGYEHRFLPNEYDSNWFVRRSDWDRKTIELKHFAGTPDQRIHTLQLTWQLSEDAPQMLTEILRERADYYKYAPPMFDRIQSILSSKRSLP
jgi:hypothetical protein